jgi:hypothetical protein
MTQMTFIKSKVITKVGYDNPDTKSVAQYPIFHPGEGWQYWDA